MEKQIKIVEWTAPKGKKAHQVLEITGIKNYPLRIGLSKVKLVLDNLEEIKKLVSAVGV